MVTRSGNNFPANDSRLLPVFSELSEEWSCPSKTIKTSRINKCKTNNKPAALTANSNNKFHGLFVSHPVSTCSSHSTNDQRRSAIPFSSKKQGNSLHPALFPTVLSWTNPSHVALCCTYFTTVTCAIVGTLSSSSTICDNQQASEKTEHESLLYSTTTDDVSTSFCAQVVERISTSSISFVSKVTSLGRAFI